jgi:hypothetical protein
MAVDEYVDLLCHETSIGKLCIEALLQQTVKRERLWRNLRRLLQIFARDLRQEGRLDDEKAAATILRTKALYVLNRMMNQLDQTTKAHFFPARNGSEDTEERLNAWLQRRPLYDSSEKSLLKQRHLNPEVQLPAIVWDDEDEYDSEESDSSVYEEAWETLPSLMSVKNFVLKSEAFAKFEQEWRNFIHPTFVSELERIVSARNLSRGTADTGHVDVQQTSHELDGLVLDLAAADFDTISISYEDLANGDIWTQMKISVEKSTSRRWDWWPFLDPIAPLTPDCAYVCWTCVR